jgi:hypothetical protein
MHFMPNNWSSKSVILLIVSLCNVAVAQLKPESRPLVLNGQAGEVSVIHINDRVYVDLMSLVRIANGSLSFQGNQISLILPAAATSSPAESPEPVRPTPQSGLSRNFRMAGIEAIAQMREWGTTLAYAIQNGYGVTEGWVADHREQAASSLRLANTAASTNADKDALQLLTNEFDTVREWSNRLVEAKRSMDTAKYTASPNALRDEPMSQKIIACGRYLGSMLAAGDYKDDPSCH